MTCMNDLCAFSLSLGMVSHAQLQIIWSVIVHCSLRYDRHEDTDTLGEINELTGVISPSWWVSALSPSCNSFLFIILTKPLL